MTATAASVDTPAEGRSADIAVLGAGLMGSALARCLVGASYSVTLWNRTSQRALDVAAGTTIRPVESIRDAVRSAPVLLACVSNYTDLLALLETAQPPAGTTLINLTTGSPVEAEAMASWSQEREVDYLDGSILSFPEGMGTEEGIVLFSGPERLWNAHEAMLRVLGKGDAVRHISADARAANVLEASIEGPFLVSSSIALVESLSFALREGVSPAEVRWSTFHTLAMIQHVAGELLDRIVGGNHVSDQVTLDVTAKVAKTHQSAYVAAGQRSRMLDTAVEVLEQGRKNGHGEAFLSILSNDCRATPPKEAATPAV